MREIKHFVHVFFFWCGICCMIASEGANGMARREKPKYNVVQNTAFVFRRYWREKPGAVIALFAFAPVNVAVSFLGILLPSVVVYCLEQHLSPTALLGATAGITGLMALAGGADRLLQGRLQAWAFYYRMQFRGDITFKKFDLDYAIAERASTRELSDRANKFVDNNSAGAEHTFRAVRVLAANILGFALYGIMTVRLSGWILTGLISASFLNYVAVWLYNRYERRVHSELMRIFNHDFYLFDRSADFEAGKDIRVYNIADWFRRLGDEIIQTNSAHAKRRETRRFFSSLAEAALILLRDGWAYVYLIGLVLAGDVGISEFVLYFGVIAGFSRWINMIANWLAELNRCSLECCDYRALMELQDKQNRGSGLPLPAADDLPPSFAFEHVKYTYHGSKHPAIDIPALQIEKGQHVAVVGRNGAGKTTFVKLLTGLYQPDKGILFLNRQNISRYNRDEYYDLFTAVFQDFSFLPGTISENVALAQNGDIDRARVSECLKLAGLSAKIASLPKGMDTPMVRDVNDEATELSGGEKQRLILARALYKTAPVLVLDEPTTALDPIAESDTYKKYASFAKNKTSVFISHRLASTRFCDRILFIENGKIVEDGTHDELMRKGGKYREMFDIQSHYYREAAGNE